MSSLIEQLDRKTLDRLDLPKTFESLQGLDKLFLEKLLNLTYRVNDIWGTQHKLDSRPAADVGAAGARFTCPVDARRMVFGIRIVYTATATVGSRSVRISKQAKSVTFGNYIVDTATASQIRTYIVAPINTSSSDVHRELSFPIHLEPEWFVEVDDASNIDNLDDVEWQIEYVELPI